MVITWASMPTCPAGSAKVFVRVSPVDDVEVTFVDDEEIAPSSRLLGDAASFFTISR